MSKKKDCKAYWYVDGRLLTDEEVESEIAWFNDILEKRKDKKNETK